MDNSPKGLFFKRFSRSDVFLVAFYLAAGTRGVLEGDPWGIAYLTLVTGFLMGRLR